jgi:DNA-directed RNA polymerase
LILFSPEGKYSPDVTEIEINTAFHYQSFETYIEALSWYKELEDKSKKVTLLYYAATAKHPFQFISQIICRRVEEYHPMTPITQDASASAYQIVSYLLLDKDLAGKTNLIKSASGENRINDFYSYIMADIKALLPSVLGTRALAEIVSDKLTRKTIKAIFMPIIYGKSQYTIHTDLRLVLSQHIL